MLYIPWLVDFYIHQHMTSLCVHDCLQILPLYKEASTIGSEPTITAYFNPIIFISNKVARWGTGVWDFSIWTLKVLVAQLCPHELYPLWLHGRKHPQAPLSLGFSRQGYWSGLPFPSPGDLPSPGIKPRSPAMQEDSSLTELTGKPLWTLGRQNSIIWLMTLAKAGLCVGVNSWNTIVVTLPDYTWD